MQQEHVEQIDDNALGREVVAGWRYSTAERKWLSSFLVDTRSSLRQVERYNNQRVYSREDLSLPPNLERSSRRIRADVIFTRRVNACTYYRCTRSNASELLFAETGVSGSRRANSGIAHASRRAAARANVASSLTNRRDFSSRN